MNKKLSIDFIKHNFVLLQVDKGTEFYYIEHFLLYEQDFHYYNNGDYLQETVTYLDYKTHETVYYRLYARENTKLIKKINHDVPFNFEHVIYGKDILRQIKINKILNYDNN